MNRTRWIIVTVVVVAAIAAIAAISSSQGGGGLVGTEEFGKAQSEGARVIDVRTPAEFSGGHIGGAENVPLDELESVASEWDRAKPVALYCATGSRSAEAATLLAGMGFKTVYDLRGGIAQWSGDVEGGTAVAEATVTPPVTGTPVMYEFYTDW